MTYCAWPWVGWPPTVRQASNWVALQSKHLWTSFFNLNWSILRYQPRRVSSLLNKLFVPEWQNWASCYHLGCFGFTSVLLFDRLKPFRCLEIRQDCNFSPNLGNFQRNWCCTFGRNWLIVLQEWPKPLLGRFCKNWATVYLKHLVSLLTHLSQRPLGKMPDNKYRCVEKTWVQEIGFTHRQNAPKD